MLSAALHQNNTGAPRSRPQSAASKTCVYSVSQARAVQASGCRQGTLSLPARQRNQLSCRPASINHGGGERCRLPVLTDTPAIGSTYEAAQQQGCPAGTDPAARRCWRSCTSSPSSCLMAAEARSPRRPCHCRSGATLPGQHKRVASWSLFAHKRSAKPVDNGPFWNFYRWAFKGFQTQLSTGRASILCAPHISSAFYYLPWHFQD